MKKEVKEVKMFSFEDIEQPKKKSLKKSIYKVTLITLDWGVKSLGLIKLFELIF